MKMSKILALNKYETDRLLNAFIESERFNEKQKINLLSKINNLIKEDLNKDLDKTLSVSNLALSTMGL